MKLPQIINRAVRVRAAGLALDKGKRRDGHYQRQSETAGGRSGWHACRREGKETGAKARVAAHGPGSQVSGKGMHDFSEKSRDGMDSSAISGVTLRSRSGDIWKSRISANQGWLRWSTS